jgi:hypothetical protein
LRRGGVDVVRESDGSWSVPSDYVARAASFEALRQHDQPVDIEILSATPLARLVTAEAATWLDHDLAGDNAASFRDAGFGAEVRAALVSRGQWLMENGYLDTTSASAEPSPSVLQSLRRRELARIGAVLEAELGKPFTSARAGQYVEGRLTQCVHGVSEKFALIERSHDFALLPWRSGLDRQLGKEIAGMVTETGISWRRGRSRNGPEIS